MHVLACEGRNIPTANAKLWGFLRAVLSFVGGKGKKAMKYR